MFLLSRPSNFLLHVILETHIIWCITNQVCLFINLSIIVTFSKYALSSWKLGCFITGTTLSETPWKSETPKHQTWNWRKFKIISNEFLTLHSKNHGFFNINIWDNWKYYLFVFISSFVSFGVFVYVKYFLEAVKNQILNRKYLLELIKGIS